MSTENDLLHRELGRFDKKLEQIVKITTEQGRVLAVQSENMKALSQRQQEFQETQKEMVLSMSELSKSILLVQNNCETRRLSYDFLQKQVTDPQGGLLVQMDRVNGKLRVFWSVVGVVGTVATIVLGLLGDYVLKRIGGK